MSKITCKTNPISPGNLNLSEEMENNVIGVCSFVIAFVDKVFIKTKWPLTGRNKNRKVLEIWELGSCKNQLLLNSKEQLNSLKKILSNKNQTRVLTEQKFLKFNLHIF